MGPLRSKAELESALARRFGAYLRFREKPEAQLVPTGVPEVDAIAGGLPRGGLTEVFGLPSSGRTSLLLSILAQATARQEICALVDTSDCFDPASAAAAGVALDQLLWVRCGGKANDALRALDLLLQGGGFGLVVFDLGEIPPRNARRIPLASWFRFRRVIENTPTVLIAIEQEPCAKTCASLVLEMAREGAAWSAVPARGPARTQLLAAMNVEVHRRKPVQPARQLRARYAFRASYAAVLPE